MTTAYDNRVGGPFVAKPGRPLGIQLVFYVCARVTRDNGQNVAFVGCWIADAAADRAQSRAVEIIQECEWQVAEVMDVRPITRDDYADDDEGLPFFLQAEVDGEVCVFFTSREQDQTE